MAIKNYWNGHLKRKLAMQQSAREIEEMTTNECLKRKELAAAVKDCPSGSSEVISHNVEKEQEDTLIHPISKKARTNTNPYCQLQNLGVLQDCKTLPFVIALSAILIELCDEKDPQMLCNILEIATRIRALKKGGKSLESEGTSNSL
eukprot:g3626.t1